MLVTRYAACRSKIPKRALNRAGKMHWLYPRANLAYVSLHGEHANCTPCAAIMAYCLGTVVGAGGDRHSYGLGHFDHHGALRRSPSGKKPRQRARRLLGVDVVNTRDRNHDQNMYWVEPVYGGQ